MYAYDKRDYLTEQTSDHIPHTSMVSLQYEYGYGFSNGEIPWLRMDSEGTGMTCLDEDETNLISDVLKFS